MKPLTQFGNVAFWSTDEYTYNEVEQARLKRRSLFGLTSATIFVVNMNVRKISIQSYGLIEESISSSYANTITNNVRGYATRGDYCGTASNAYYQILQVLEGNRIAQPMKYFSNACIALMLGLIIMISAVFRHSSSFIRPSVSTLLAYTVGGAVTAYALKRVLTGSERRYSPVTSSSSGSSCSSCGGGGGGGCSSCGSGGSSSF